MRAERDEYGIDYSDDIEEGYLTLEEVIVQRDGIREHYSRNGWDMSLIAPGTIVRRHVVEEATDWQQVDEKEGGTE